MLPKIASGDANKMWIIPSEIGDALKGLGSAFGSSPGIPHDSGGPKKRFDLDAPVVPDTSASLSRAHQEVQEAIESARMAEPQARGTGSIPVAPGTAAPTDDPNAAPPGPPAPPAS
jgi:hypothetical protein